MSEYKTESEQDKPSFEKDLEKLEEIVQALEEGGLSLDESLKRFEEGIRLSKRCEKALTEAEKKIEMLTKNAEGELEAEPFDETTVVEGGAEKASPSETGEATPTDAAGNWEPESPEAAEDEYDEDGGLLF